MILTTPSPWTDALEWFLVHQRERLAVVLTRGGLTIEGPALYEHVEQTEGQFGVVLSGLCFWIAESEISQVWIDPDDDGLLVVADDLMLYLRPHP